MHHVGGMTKRKSRIRSLIRTVALLRRLTVVITGLVVDVTGLLIAFGGLAVVVTEMIRRLL
jgi:hypothetical protein